MDRLPAKNTVRPASHQPVLVWGDTQAGYGWVAIDAAADSGPRLRLRGAAALRALSGVLADTMSQIPPEQAVLAGCELLPFLSADGRIHLQDNCSMTCYIIHEQAARDLIAWISHTQGAAGAELPVSFERVRQQAFCRIGAELYEMGAAEQQGLLDVLLLAIGVGDGAEFVGAEFWARVGATTPASLLLEMSWRGQGGSFVVTRTGLARLAEELAGAMESCGGQSVATSAQ